MIGYLYFNKETKEPFYYSSGRHKRGSNRHIKLMVEPPSANKLKAFSYNVGVHHSKIAVIKFNMDLGIK